MDDLVRVGTETFQNIVSFGVFEDSNGSKDIWGTQKDIVISFGTTKQVVSYHLNKMFQSGELQRDKCVKKILTHLEDGRNYLTDAYNLKAIIHLGFAIDSPVAIAFRNWSSEVLQKYMVNGHVEDDRLMSLDSLAEKFIEIGRQMERKDMELQQAKRQIAEKDETIASQQTIIDEQSRFVPDKPDDLDEPITGRYVPVKGTYRHIEPKQLNLPIADTQLSVKDGELKP